MFYSGENTAERAMKNKSVNAEWSFDLCKKISANPTDGFPVLEHEVEAED